MTEVSQDNVPAMGWRLKLGVALFGLSIVLPVLGVPLVATMGLSTATVTTVSGIMLVGAEVLGVVAVAIMGKSGYAYMKNRVFGFLRQYGPPAEVSRTMAQIIGINKDNTSVINADKMKRPQWISILW